MFLGSLLDLRFHCILGSGVPSGREQVAREEQLCLKRRHLSTEDQENVPQDQVRAASETQPSGKVFAI